MLGLSAIAWLAFGPVNSQVVAGNHSFALLVLESLLSYVWICGLQSLFFGLIPIRYMDGEAVYKWSKIAWTTMFVIITFIFVQFVMHPSAAGYGGNVHTNLLPMISIFIVSGLAALTFWVVSHYRWRKMVHEGVEHIGEGIKEGF